MKIPLLWLRDYIELEEDAATLAERMTFAGIEVEGIHTVGGTYEGLCAAQVRQVQPHPHADRLKRCAVFDGTREWELVCGAPHVNTEQCYAFAAPGVTLPSGAVLAERTIRGVRSQGMLCAEDELGLSDDHSGLYELPPGTRPGTPLAAMLGPPETVLDVEITPNRPDCLSLLGIARELAALLGRPWIRPEPRLAERDPAVAHWARVEVHDSVRCPRYSARVLTDVHMAPAPAEIRRRLRLAGIRPISNVVDATNFVMIECGQPLHAFDLRKLSGGRIIVRGATEGETVTTLDGQDHRVSSDTLVIADAERPVALAGIMGGAESEIDEHTRTVLLESAHFEPDLIRRTARSVGLSTESSYRFERRTDVAQTAWACRRAAALITDWGAAGVARGAIDLYPHPPAPRRIRCRVQRLNRLLGIRSSARALNKMFTALELPVKATEAGSCTVEIPSFRPDLEREVDLIEEFARLHGLDRIPAAASRARIVPGADDRGARARFVLQDRLAALGLREICTYSMVSPGLLDRFDAGERASRVVLPNPISRDQSVLRTSLIPQMVEALGANRARQIETACLFEMGKVFTRRADGKISEHERVALGVMGPAGRAATDSRRPVSREEMFLWLKGMLEEGLCALRLPEVRFKEERHAVLEPGFAVQVLLQERAIGWMGLVRQTLAAEWRFSDPVAVAECLTQPLLTGIFTLPTVHPPAPYPPIGRDMALMVDAGVRHADILNIVRRAAPPELEHIELFDVFEKEDLGAGRKSMAYALLYRSPTRTLTDAEANGYHERVKDALRAALPVEIREG